MSHDVENDRMINNRNQPQGELMRMVTICNLKGLHARAAAKFVKTATDFQANILVTKKDQKVPGSSIMGLMMLAAGIGCQLELRASGEDAEAALNALTDLVNRKFDEE
jgi:phosphocarrier protein